ncbi:unnamed protein product [Dovyalis caffra]|uniref:Uncharacterized protein n=1 Tax=Dovyalis caffra TaxID=77055 RepID=A0AAV1S1M2_9ROSI|nr:unnamed protein product [Dovyalis caffra]
MDPFYPFPLAGETDDVHLRSRSRETSNKHNKKDKRMLSRNNSVERVEGDASSISFTLTNPKVLDCTMCFQPLRLPVFPVYVIFYGDDQTLLSMLIPQIFSRAGIKKRSLNAEANTLIHQDLQYKWMVHDSDEHLPVSRTTEDEDEGFQDEEEEEEDKEEEGGGMEKGESDGGEEREGMDPSA